MRCDACGEGPVALEDSTGGTTEGRFTERYECQFCGATGRIEGEAGAPSSTWSRRGRVFG